MKLERETVKEIKALLWKGVSNADVARRIGCSDAHVSRISTGNAWFDVPWPNGQVGGINPTHHAWLVEQRLRGPSPRGSEDEMLPVGSGEIEDVYKRNRRDNPANSSLVAGSTSPQPTPVEPDSQGHSGLASHNADGRGSGEPDQGDPVEAEAPLDHDPEAAFHQREARNLALSQMAEVADADMQRELEEAVAGTTSKARTTPIALGLKRPALKPHYELLAWDKVLEHGSQLPLVRAAADNDELRRCVQAAFKMLPRSLWDSPKAIVLVSDVAKSLDIDLGKE